MNTSSDVYSIFTDGLEDKLKTIQSIANVDLEELRTELDNSGYKNITTLPDNTSVDFASAVNVINKKISALQTALNNLLNKANYHIENITLFENGQEVTIEEKSSVSSVGQSGTTMTVKEGDTLWNLAISLGYDGSEWNKIFKNIDGSEITSAQAVRLSGGDQILFIGKSQTSSNVDYIKIVPSLTPVAALEAIDMSDDVIYKDISSDVFGTIYGSYSSLANPFAKSAPLKRNGEGKAVSGMYISGSMGYYSDGRRHEGNDFNYVNGEDLGIDIYPAAEGIVVEVKADDGSKKGLGNSVTILSKVINPDGTEGYMLTTYGHMQNTSTLQVGQVVTSDDVIGQVGKTGNASGSHLHLTSETNLTPNNVKDFSVDDLTTYEKVVDGKTITMVKTEDKNTEQTISKLYGEGGAFKEQVYKVKYGTTRSEWDNYVEENNIASKKYDNGMSNLYL